jgi:hypothetical protein
MGISKRPDYLIDDAAIEAWRWPNFTPQEFACRGSGRLLIVPAYMDKLQRLRTMYGRPLVVTSGYRPPEHNRVVSSTGLQRSPHDWASDAISPSSAATRLPSWNSRSPTR